MIQGIYLATQAMTIQTQKQDQVANNLANLNTAGFKQSSLFARAYQRTVADEKLHPYANREIKADECLVDYREGQMRKTGSPLDVMIKGSGFFTAMTSEGVRYTRNGNFALDPDGFLIAFDGSKVLGKEGFIRFDGKGDIRINERGEIYQGEQHKGTLRIADFRKPYRLLREQNTMLRPQLPDNPEIQSAGFTVNQGYLEGSNVELIKNMVAMISSQRAFEADSKALQAQDQTLDKAVNQIGRVG
ncbi:MAG: flagellar basal-body rod protein FlgF [Chitinivibrionales bacterium]